jgi:hypothetical protein
MINVNFNNTLCINLHCFFNLFGSDPMKWRVMEDEFVNIKESSYQSKAVSPCFSLLAAYF